MPTQVTIQTTKVYQSDKDDPEEAVADARSGALKAKRIQENVATASAPSPNITTRTLTTEPPIPSAAPSTPAQYG